MPSPSPSPASPTSDSTSTSPGTSNRTGTGTRNRIRSHRTRAAVCVTLTACALALAPTPATGTAPPENAADRALRAFLDHGPKAAVMTAAHRGQWRKAPENSLPAIRAAFADGAEIVEVDIQLSKDGVPVLMHDETLERTTNGTGRVADRTVAQLRALRLRVGLGGRQAALTRHRVPTLADAMKEARTRGLVNLDQAWREREAVMGVLKQTGTVRNGVFKSRAAVPEVRAFRARHRDALYMHLVDDDNAGAVKEFGKERPPAFEVVFDDAEDEVAGPAFLKGVRGTGRVWINSMRDEFAAGHTDEASLIDPARGWGRLIGTYGATVIQTDNVEALRTYLAKGPVNKVPPGAVRIQGEAYAPGKDGVTHHDTDPGNRGDGPGRPGEGVDICDHDGAVAVCWMRGTEWLTYTVDVPRTGDYTLKARVSSPYSPAGTYRLTVDRGPASGPVRVANTTAHHAFVLQGSGVTRRLDRGRHTLRISLDDKVPQNWNLDHLQLEPVRR
ncbi:glycerophosphodiester phosphodiesterase family protein [Streptomyces silvensis]|uniref:glycerophosphodiester phosphodiesterase family protein n=1 Tax=Streptomyces silvensis TaxID=1765722 RepID=UPI00099F147F|nr:glycerophosphodiester phosphodiesterase family protein [Streptomyces silvensis]